MTDTIWFQYGLTLVRGAGVTIQLSWLALVLAAIVGTIIALARMSNFFGLRILALLYTEFMRSIPVILLLFFCYYGVPTIIGVDIGAFVAATVALSLHASASMSEIVRAGIESVGTGQWDAARASGMRFGTAMRYVVAPQAFRVILPPAVSIFVATIKASSLAVIIGYRELMNTALFIRSQTGHGLEIIVIAAVMYFGICYTVSHLGGMLEQRLGIRTSNAPRLADRALDTA